MADEILSSCHAVLNSLVAPWERATVYTVNQVRRGLLRQPSINRSSP